MFSLNCKGRLHCFTEPVVMGIINATPDSFYAGSRQQHIDDALRKAAQMLEEGAGMLDIGGQSTRPGSERVPADEEAQRVLPVVDAVHRRFPDVLLSIDTFYASVATGAVEAGACLVNDVSAGTIDEGLLPAVAQLKVPYVLMHMPGDPQTMQTQASYKNVVTEVFDFFSFRLKKLQHAGIHDLIIDPGFGFGKTAEHNFTLLQHLSFFRQLGQPVMVGLSRKATVYKTLGITAPEALNGTTALHTIALLQGASLLRVHDVKEAVQVVRLMAAYTNKKEQPV
jgi:dihydropteroate synthase